MPCLLLGRGESGQGHGVARGRPLVSSQGSSSCWWLGRRLGRRFGGLARCCSMDSSRWLTMVVLGRPSLPHMYGTQCHHLRVRGRRERLLARAIRQEASRKPWEKSQLFSAHPSESHRCTAATRRPSTAFPPNDCAPHLILCRNRLPSPALCCVVMCHAVLCCAVVCRGVPCCGVPCCAVLWFLETCRRCGRPFGNSCTPSRSPDAAMMVHIAKLPSKLLPLASVYRPTAYVHAANDALMVRGYKHMTGSSRHAHTEGLWGPWEHG